MRLIINLLFLAFATTAFSQGTITGTVVDENIEPLLGAAVSITGTTSGYITDIDGRFSVPVNEFPISLTINYLGYQPKDIEVNESKDLGIIKLEPKSESLNQVVVIGYGSVQKGELTGAVGTINPNENAVDNNQSVEELIQGRVAGVQVTQTGRQPGDPTSIRIRGVNSLTGNTQPLYVVDGIIINSATEDTLDPLSGGNSYLAPQGGIAGINPRDIETIQILKDASATAIYGSRGSNGVVLITTKKGVAGKVKVNINHTTTIGRVTNDIDVLDTEGYVAYRNEEAENRDLLPKFYTYPDGSFAAFQNSEQFMIDNADTIERLEGVDWSDEIYRTSVTTNTRVSASGGSEDNRYYIAAGYLNNEGVVPRTYSRSTDFNARLNNQLGPKTTLDSKFVAQFTKNSASKGTENLGGTNNNIIRQIINGAPILDFDEDNEGLDFDTAIDGPRAWIEGYDDLADDLRILGLVNLEQEINDVFKLRVRVGADYRNKKRSVWYGNELFRGRQSNGEAGRSTLERFRYNIDNQLIFRKKFNKNHRINGTVGFVIDQSQIERTTYQATNFANQDLRADGISFGQASNPLFFDTEKETIISGLARINYSLMNKYLFTATMRADGSSKFAEGERFGYFPSIAGAWRMDREKWLRKNKSISNLKLRASWGLTGNQGIPNYRYLTPFGPTQSPYSDAQGNPLVAIVPLNLANPDLTWEKTSQYNVGVDVGFLDERFTASIDAYQKNIRDLLLNVDIPGSTGFDRFFNNQGELINKGLELAVSADIISNENLTWNVFGNLSFYRNEIGQLGIEPTINGTVTGAQYLGNAVSGGNFFKQPANIYVQGRSAGLFFGFETDGIIQNTDDLNNSPDFRGETPELGDVKLVDQNGDGNITDEDLTIIGDPNPDFTYGFGSRLDYKRFSLSLFFNGVQGNEIANGNLLREAYADQTSANVRTVAYRDAWRPDNPTGSFPRVGYDLNDEVGFTDRIVEDGSFLRLNYVTLGYDVPVDKIGFIDSAYISVSGQNLLLITDYSGFDPEVDSFSFDPSRSGIDWQSFPNSRSYVFSVNVSF